MKLLFRETMAGKTDDGRAFAFHVSVEAPHVSSLGLKEMLRVFGTAELEGRATNVPVEGTLVIGLPWRPFLEYELGFKSDDGAVWRFAGKKTVSLLRPVHTMTTLYGKLYENGAEKIGCTLHFALRDLPAFLGSVRLVDAAEPRPELAAG